MFSYTICDSFSEQIYMLTCKTLEKRVPNIRKRRSLHDVDDTRIQLYTCGKAEIKVVNDYSTDVVYIDSEIDLSPYIMKKE